jgi:type I site-specific restriction endonuclease
MTPEQRARQQIDLLLQQCGWIVQDRSQRNLAAGPGVAIREALLKGGEADYLLFADGKAIATVEAKPEGYTLSASKGRRQNDEDPLSQTFLIEASFPKLNEQQGHELL